MLGHSVTILGKRIILLTGRPGNQYLTSYIAQLFKLLIFLLLFIGPGFVDAAPPYSHFETINNPHTRKLDYYYRRGIKHSNTLPATCSQGEVYADDDATSGQRFYYCESTDTWKLQGDGAGGGSGSMTTTKESDTPVGDADIVTLDFGLGFDLAESPDTEIQITLDFSEIAGHDSFTDFVANEHIDWTGDQGATNIHTGNYPITDSEVPNDITIDLAAAATALAANGGNCSAGQSPLGVDASGAVESCFDVWTEAENTAAGYISATLTQEEVDDYVYALINDGDSVHTRITITYDDTDNAYDFVVDAEVDPTVDTAGEILAIIDDTALDFGTGVLTAAGFVGALTGNADTVTNATLTTALTVDTGTVGLTGNVANTSVLTLGAGASSVSGANTGDSDTQDLGIDGNNVTLVDGGTADISTTTAVTANSGKVTESTTAGRSLTLSTYEVNADAELYTDSKGAWIETPAVEAMNGIILGLMNTSTITFVKCMTDAGTVNIMLEDGADADILSAALVCDVGGQTSCASGCDVNTLQNTAITALTEDIDLDIEAVDTATELYLMIGYTKND